MITPAKTLVPLGYILKVFAVCAVLVNSNTLLLGNLQHARLSDNVDWAKFLLNQSPSWNKLPQNWTEAPFLGNGMLGIQVYQYGDYTLRVDIGRGDVQEHRLPVSGRMNDRCRLPVGYFTLQSNSRLIGASLTLSLYDATLSGSVTTDAGSIELKAYVHAKEDLIVVQTDVGTSDVHLSWEWNPLPAINPRWSQKPSRIKSGDQQNPTPINSSVKGINRCVQELVAGGETATAWIESTNIAGRQTLLVSVCHSYPFEEARYTAVDTVAIAASTEMDRLLNRHLAWWHSYFPQSFVSISDPYWESFYWIQMYKLASATRADGMLIDNQGPWLQPTGWPGAWWNLNVQLSYWPTLTSNRHALAGSLVNVFRDHRAALYNAVPKTYRETAAGLGRETGQELWGQELTEPGSSRPEVGHLTWAMHNLWLLYRHSQDTELLRKTIYPLLRRSINFYLQFLQKGASGQFQLPQTWSPEYKELGPNASYDLALLRWGCETLIECGNILQINDPLKSAWEDTLENLAPFPTDSSGMLIAEGVPLTYGHRHYSHLLAFYPLYLLNSETPGAETLMLNSLQHWYSLEHEGDDQLAGYSFTGAASLSAAFGRGNDALKYLNRLRPRLYPNTLYGETDTPFPVIESPLSAAQSIHDMLLQSWGNSIRIFPAMPEAWENGTFHNLSAEGGFLVSAARKNGQTIWIRIKSLYGNTTRLHHGFRKNFSVSPTLQNAIIYDDDKNSCLLQMQTGEEILLWINDEAKPFDISPVNPDQQISVFGLR